MTRVSRTPAPSLAATPRTSRTTARSASGVDLCGATVIRRLLEQFSRSWNLAEVGRRRGRLSAGWGRPGMAALQARLPAWQLRQHAALFLCVETGPAGDLLDAAQAAATERGRGIERADADARRDGRGRAHLALGCDCGAPPGALADFSGAGASSRSSSLVRIAVAL